MKKLVLAHIFAFGALFSASAMANDEVPSDDIGEISEHDEIHCFEAPGSVLCREMRRFDNLLISCTGNAACYSLWDRQLDVINTIENWYYRYLGRDSWLERELGQEIGDISSKLCRQRITGDPVRVTELTVGYNTLLRIFEDLQIRAGIERPRTCQFSVN